MVASGVIGGALTVCLTPSSFTMTGVPGAAALKKVSAMPCGIRMHPCEAAYGGT